MASPFLFFSVEELEDIGSASTDFRIFRINFLMFFCSAPPEATIRLRKANRHNRFELKSFWVRGDSGIRLIVKLHLLTYRF